MSWYRIGLGRATTHFHPLAIPRVLRPGNIGWVVAARGATSRGTCVPPLASTSIPRTGTPTTASVVPGWDLDSMTLLPRTYSGRRLFTTDANLGLPKVIASGGPDGKASSRKCDRGNEGGDSLDMRTKFREGATSRLEAFSGQDRCGAYPLSFCPFESVERHSEVSA